MMMGQFYFTDSNDTAMKNLKDRKWLSNAFVSSFFMGPITMMLLEIGSGFWSSLKVQTYVSIVSKTGVSVPGCWKQISV